ncbi:MAG: malectin domain-containing carbohydrate-binding protein [Bacteroidota bacterium]
MSVKKYWSHFAAGLANIGKRLGLGLALVLLAQGLHAQVTINVGGPAVGTFAADSSFSGGSVATNSSTTIDTSAVANPAPQAAYRDERYGNFTYTVGNLAPAAIYRVRLHFVESYWTAAKQRVFNVLINGTASLSSFDIFAAAGARNKAVIREFNVPATAAGNITLQFASLVNYAKVDAIEVLPIPLVAINAGGPVTGNLIADAGFSGGAVAANASTLVDTTAVINPAPPAAYVDERYGNFSYTVTNLKPAALYRLRLHFVESYWTAAKQRVFNVLVNGTAVLSNFDIFATAGAKNKVVIKEFDVPAASTGNITVQFVPVVNNAKLDALELYTGSAALAAVLTPPANLNALPGNASASLSWSAVPGASSYNVKQAQSSSGPFSTLGNVTTTSYTSSGLTNGTPYYYVASAVNLAGESPNSAVASVTPSAPSTSPPPPTTSLPVAPATLGATPGNGSATISWGTVSGATGYNVKRASTSAGPYTTIASSQTATSYTNSGLSNGITYYYVVSAVNAAGEGPNSGYTSVTPVAPPVASSSTNPLGMNIGGTSDWDQLRLFADVIAMSRDFMVANTNGNGPTKVAVDSNGWPTSDFSFLVWAGMDQMQGTYAFSFTGQATVTGNFSNLSLNYDPASNTSSGTFQYTNSGSSYLALNFAGTRRTATSSTGSGVTQIKLMRPLTPGSTQPHPVTELFNRATKAELAKFQVIRFMDFLATNASVQTNWSDRPRPTFASFKRNPGGAYGWQGLGGPLEHVIRLSNELGTDAWIDIPARATDDYVRKVAQLFAYGSDGVNPYTSPQSNPVYPPLNPNLKLYVEYSNELWNSAGPFTQSSDNCKAASDELVSSGGNSPLNYDRTWNGVAWGGSGFDWAKCWRRVAKRGAEVSVIFRSVFGDAAMMTRVRPVLMSQLGYAGGPLFSALQMMLGYYNNFAGNFVATPRPPNYYFYGAGGSAYYSPSSSVSSLTAFFSDPRMLPSGFTPPLQQDMAMVSALGLKRIAYEGGPSLDRTGGVRDPISAQAVNDPRMTTTMVNLHNAWSANGGDLLVYFTAAGDFQWGFTNNIYNLSTPKLAAIDQLRTATRAPVTYGTLIPGTVSGASPVICSRNWTCAPLQPATFAPGGSNVTWANYAFRATSSAARSVTLSFSSATSAQVAVYVDGALAGTQTTSGGALIFNAGTLEPGVHGIIVRAVSGSFTLSSVAVQ